MATRDATFKWVFLDDDMSDDDMSGDESYIANDWWKADFRMEMQIEGEVVGTITGCVLERQGMTENFHELVDGVSEGLSNLCCALFNNRGDLYPKLFNDVFSDEMNSGQIIYLDRLIIERKHRRKGYGTALLQGLVKHLDRTCGIIVAWPTSMDFESYFPETAEERVLMSGLIRMYRRAGFRRVGTTEYYCCVPKPSHACFDTTATDLEYQTDKVELSASDEAFLDLISTKVVKENDLGLIKTLAEEPDFVERATRLNVLHMLCSERGMGKECKNYLVIIDFLVQLGLDINSRWTIRNNQTPLHIAASEMNLDLVQYLLLHGANEEYLDDDECTPKELAEDALWRWKSNVRQFASVEHLSIASKTIRMSMVVKLVNSL